MFSPFGDVIFVKRVQSGKVSSGIQQRHGIATKIGPTVSGISEGDELVFGHTVGTEIELGGEKLLAIRFRDIIGIMDKPLAYRLRFFAAKSQVQTQNGHI